MPTHEYKIIKESTHTKLAEAINREAADGWEPINVYSIGVSVADHFALIRRALPAG